MGIPGFVTPDELSDAMDGAGKPISAATIRYHCRDRRGMLYDQAKRFKRAWLIPADVAGKFAAEWSPYDSLRKK